MPYHLKNRTPRSRNKFIWFLVVIAIVISLAIPGFFFAIGAFFAGTTTQVKSGIVSGYDIFISYFSGQTRLARKNLELQSVVNEINGYKAENEFLNSEMEKMRGYTIDINSSIANVIIVPPEAPYTMMVVSNAKDSNIGDIVTTVSGVYLGEIVEKSSSYAKVDLLSRGGNIFFVENARTGERYELQGKGGNNFLANLPKDIDIEKGDLLVKRGDKTFIVGTVKEIEVRESSPFVAVYIDSPVSIYSLQHVLIHSLPKNEFIPQ